MNVKIRHLLLVGLCIYNYHTNEILIGTKNIDHIFRSRIDEKTHPIDPRLIDLIKNIQDHFKADCVELISGYRSKELNAQLKKTGANVADESMHTEGKAADIHIDEVSEEAVAAYARSLKIGGVGYYPGEDFVHVDTGNIRNWDFSDKPGRPLMAFRKGDIWQITTDKDVYFDKELIPITIMNITRTPKQFNAPLILEHFRRGNWETVTTANFCAGQKIPAGSICSKKWVPSENDPFGRFRIIIKGSLQTRSNEFYRKQL